MKILRAEPAAGARPEDRLTVGVAQIAPVWLDRVQTIAKIAATARRAAEEGCRLVAFGEALAPGYPFWLDRTGAARFDDPKQKVMHARYVDEGVVIERGDLDPVCEVARECGIAVYVGVMERAPDRGGHSLYCTLVYIDEAGSVQSVHRKLHPTYEERLAWAQGDGHGLVVHALGAFRVGGLNCYENWLPLARSALYAQGMSLHVSVWPGGLANTADLPRFIALESRGYVIAASGLLRVDDVPDDVPGRDEIIAAGGPVIANGGSTIVGPDGRFLVDPIVDVEALIVAEIDHALVRGERQNLDQAGHYARPDVLSLDVNRRRQRNARFHD